MEDQAETTSLISSRKIRTTKVQGEASKEIDWNIISDNYFSIFDCIDFPFYKISK